MYKIVVEDKLGSEGVKCVFIKSNKMINCIFLLSVILCFSFTDAVFADNVGGVFVTPSGTTAGYSEMTYSFHPYATTSDFSMGWVAVANDQASEAQYAQVGWIRGGFDPNQSYSTVDTRYFFEWSNSGTDWNRVRNKTGPAVGSKHAYKVGFGSNTVYGYSDDALIGSHVMVWNKVTITEYCGEQINKAKFPGKVSLHEFIDCPQYKVNGAWTPVTAMYKWFRAPNVLYGGLDTTKFNKANAYRFDIWDTRVQ